MATRRLAKRRQEVRPIHSKNSNRKLRDSHRSTLELLERRVLLTAQPFIGGDLVVYRVGDGTAALTNGGNPIFLDEYRPDGTLVQSIEMPFSANASDMQGGVQSPPATPNPIVNAGLGKLNDIDRAREILWIDLNANRHAGAAKIVIKQLLKKHKLCDDATITAE